MIKKLCLAVLNAALAVLNAVMDLALAIVGFVVNQWKQYNPLGQFLFVLALGAIYVDASIAHEYGTGMSKWHAYGFAIVALAFCVLPDVAVSEWRKGCYGAAFALGLGCVPLGIVSLLSHTGYGAGVRLGDVQQTGFQHASLESARVSLKSERDNLDMLRGQLADLKARNASHRDKNHGFAVTVDPVAAKLQLDALDQAIENEAAGRRGRGKGCFTECEKLKEQRGKLAGFIAAIKEENDLTDRITKAQRAIDAKEAKIADMGFHSSPIMNQNDTVAKLFNLAAMAFGSQLTTEQAIKPTLVQRDLANTGSAGIASIAFLLAGPLLMLGAGLNRIGGGHGGTTGPVGGTPLPVPGPAPASMTVAASTPSTVRSPTLVPAVAAPVALPAPKVTAPAATAGGDLSGVEARRQRVAIAMRQSRVDGRLLKAA